MVKLKMTKKIRYKIVGKYIKDLIFSIPNAKTFFLLSKDIKNYKINIDIKSNQIEKKIIEIQTSISLNPSENKSEKINTKIIFATIIEILDEKIEKEEIKKIILINVPTEIYAELRKIFISLFENSGFKNIKISENVDFAKLYNLRRVQ